MPRRPVRARSAAHALRLAFAAAALAWVVPAKAASALDGEYVCVYGCRPTDANPTVSVRGDEADCVDELGGLFKGQRLSENAVSCFRQTGVLGPDGQTITWSNGVIWRRRAAAP